MKTNSINQSVSRTLIIIFGVIMILTACKSTKKESADTDEPAEDPSSKESVIQELTTYPLPDAYEVTDMLQKAGASYILTLSNPASNVGNYISSSEKALKVLVTPKSFPTFSQKVNSISTTGAAGFSTQDKVLTSDPMRPPL